VKTYTIVMEISGPLGMFPDPATGGNSTSLPIPPPSACVGIIESICRFPGVDVQIQAVAVCSPKIVFQSLDYNNSSGNERKLELIKKQSSWQVSATILKNPTFQIIATLRNNHKTGVKPNNNAHAMQDRFLRRLKKGQSFRTPTLGHREFIAEYCGKPRTSINTKLNLEIAAFPFGNAFSGFAFRKQELKNGIAIFEKHYQPSIDEHGCLTLL